MDTAGKVINCLAAVVREFNKPLSVETIQVAPPKRHEVRVKVCFASMCQTDLHLLHGHTAAYAHLPQIVGHEGAGIVESIGEDVEGFQPGDHVVLHYLPRCKTCSYCLSNKTNLCIKSKSGLNSGTLADGTTRFTDSNGQQIHHFFGISTFSQYTVVADNSLAKVNPSAPLRHLPLIGCCIGTGYGAAINTCQIEKGTTVAVWGLGAVGLSAVMGAKAAGAKRIIGIDILESKFPIAAECGATDFINPTSLTEGVTVPQKVNELVPGGTDYTIECIGRPDTVKDAIDSAHESWGKACVIGVCMQPIKLSVVPDIIYGRSIISSIYGGTSDVDVPNLVEKCLDGSINVSKLVSHERNLNQIQEAVTLLEKGLSIRTVIDMHNGESSNI